MTRLFGTDGIRGEAGKFPLDAPTVKTVGASLATHLKHKLGRNPVIIVGRDTRESGAWIEQALAAGASSIGAEVKSAGVITTPGVAYLARTCPADAGVVISASHNPYQDNGLKIFAPSGRKLDEMTERLIEDDVANARTAEDSSAPNVSAPGLDDVTQRLRERYLNYLVSEIGRGLVLKGVRLLLDCANGAASTVASDLFERLGAEVTTLNNAPNGRNINLDCGSLHMEGLQHETITSKADLGVAFDGDADRSLFVDADGRLVNGDATLWVLGKHMQDKSQLHQNTVVATVMSNIGLELAFQSRGIKLVRTDVGDKYVLDELIRSGSSLGGEQSGHIIFPGISLAGDGLITTLCVLRAMTEAERSLKELTEGFQNFPQILVNVKVKRKPPFGEVAVIKDAAQRIESSLGTRGRLLLRYSGTESLARVMIEGESQEQIETQAAELASVIQESLGE